jgi:hypothetical protein
MSSKDFGLRVHLPSCSSILFLEIDLTSFKYKTTINIISILCLYIIIIFLLKCQYNNIHMFHNHEKSEENKNMLSFSSTNIERDTIHASMMIEVLKYNLGTLHWRWDLGLVHRTSHFIQRSPKTHTNHISIDS